MAARKSREPRTPARKAAAKRPREPTPAALLKKVAAISDSNKALQKEIKVMARIFADNQKVMVSLKGAIDSVADSLDHIQRQSRRMGVVEEDTKKLYAGLGQMRAQSGLVEKLGAQAERMRKEIAGLQKSGPAGLSKKVDDGLDSIRNNSKMITKIAQRIDEVRDGLRSVSGGAGSFKGIGGELDKLRAAVKEVAEKAQGLEAGSQVADSLKGELGRIAESARSAASLGAELGAVREAVDAVSEKASGVEPLAGMVKALRAEFESVAKKAGGMAGLESKMVGVEEALASVSNMVRRQEAASSEMHAKSEELYSEMRKVGGAAGKASDDSSKEVLALLKLSEFQSSIRMGSESKYGGTADLEKMAAQTAEIVNLFDRLSVESGRRMPLPEDVRRWAIGKILDCADRWEVRFGDVYSVLSNAVGRDMLKESIRVRQVRDIYGIRAVDELRSDLGIS